MNAKSTRRAAVAACLISAQAALADQPNPIVFNQRCTQDQLAWNAFPPIEGRFAWVAKCWSPDDPAAKLVIHTWANGAYKAVIEATDGPEEATHPTYMSSDLSQTWTGPNGPPTTGGAPCRTAPFHGAWYLCANGCFRGDQLVLFADGYHRIDDAIDAKLGNIVTLSDDATFEDLRLKVSNVREYTRDPVPAKQRLLLITTEDGGSLAVTPDHPLINGDGVMVRAGALHVGDRLVRVSGARPSIVSLKATEFYGKVANVTPDAASATSNILVAQGFLSGSHQQQERSLEDVNRQIFRGLAAEALSSEESP